MVNLKMMVEGGPKAWKKAFPGIKKAALQKAIRWWHEKILPKHFTTNAYHIYGYKRRTPKYIARKLKKTGQNRPLVYTGRLMQALTRYISLSGTSKGAKGRMRPPPKYIYKSGTRAGQPDKRAEILAIHPSELKLMAGEVEEEIAARLNEIKETEVFE